MIADRISRDKPPFSAMLTAFRGAPLRSVFYEIGENMTKYTIGVDFGSLSARATLVRCDDGKEIAAAEHAYDHAVMTERDINGSTPSATTALQDADDYLIALGDTVNSVITSSGVDRDEIGAIAIDFTASNILPVLKDGTPLSRLDKFSKNPHAYVKMWKHHGAVEEAQILTEAARDLSPELLLSDRKSVV